MILIKSLIDIVFVRLFNSPGNQYEIGQGNIASFLSFARILFLILAFIKIK